MPGLIETTALLAEAIAEIERLRAENAKLLLCEVFGSMSETRKQAFLDAAKMADREARIKYDETTEQAVAGNKDAANQLYAADQALRRFATTLRRAANGGTDASG